VRVLWHSILFLNTDGLIWWSPIQVIATIYGVSVCVCVLRCQVLDIAAHLGKYATFFDSYRRKITLQVTVKLSMQCQLSHRPF